MQGSEHPHVLSHQPRLDTTRANGTHPSSSPRRGSSKPRHHAFAHRVAKWSSPAPVAALPPEPWFQRRGLPASSLSGWKTQWTERSGLTTVAQVAQRFFAASHDTTMAARCDTFHHWLCSCLDATIEDADVATEHVCRCVLEMPPAARYAAMTGTKDETPYADHMATVCTRFRDERWSAAELFAFESALGVQLPTELRVLLLNGGPRTLTLINHALTIDCASERERGLPFLWHLATDYIEAGVGDTWCGQHVHSIKEAVHPDIPSREAVVSWLRLGEDIDYMQGSIVVADIPGGTEHLVLTGEHRGEVWRSCLTHRGPMYLTPAHAVDQPFPRGVWDMLVFAQMPPPGAYGCYHCDGGVPLATSTRTTSRGSTGPAGAGAGLATGSGGVAGESDGTAAADGGDAACAGAGAVAGAVGGAGAGAVPATGSGASAGADAGAVADDVAGDVSGAGADAGGGPPLVTPLMLVLSVVLSVVLSLVLSWVLSLT